MEASPRTLPHGLGCPKCADPVAWTVCRVCGWSLRGQEEGGGVEGNQGDPKPPKARREPPDTRSEKERQAAIVRVFTDAGFWTWNLSQPRATSQAAGLPDFIVTGRGAVLFVECKSRSGRLTNAQKQFRSHVTANNGLYAVLRSESQAADWIRKWLERPVKGAR